MTGRNMQGPLFFEKIVKSASSVGGLRGGAARSATATAATATPAAPARIPGFPLDGYTRRKKLTRVAQIFLGDPLGNGFGTFKSRCGVKMAAVLT